MNMIRIIFPLTIITLLYAACTEKGATGENELKNKNQVNMVAKETMTDNGIVRISKIEIYPEYLSEYLHWAVVVGETSIRSEPGVLTMYAMQDKNDSCRITILETYSSQEAYQSHIASPHFKKYKQGTLHMVKNLELCDQNPLNPRSSIASSIIND